MATAEERLSWLEGAYEHVATKADIAGLRAEVKADIAGVETQVTGLRAELKSDISNVETQISGLRAELKADIAGVETAISGLQAKVNLESLDIRAEMYRINASQIKWTVSFMAAYLVIGLGAATAIFSFLG